MINYEIGNDFDAVFIESELELFNNHSKRSPQDEEYKKFIIVVKKNQQIIGGGIAYSSLYYIGYIDTLWVDEKFRNQSIGTKILSLLESKLREYGCELCHLDTFNFQAPVFYKKNGYEIFGELHHKKQNITEYFKKKDLC
jgi:ribosomal protein S18 acetylase RimI-like enzyme